jgi:hypothetical protein
MRIYCAIVWSRPAENSHLKDDIRRLEDNIKVGFIEVSTVVVEVRWIGLPM